jgi:hypothetical protein
LTGNVHQDNPDKLKNTARIYSNTVKDGSGSWFTPLLDSDGHLQIDLLSGVTTYEVVGIKDASDVRINPAKEDGNLATLAGKDFATSAKQDTIIGHVDGIEGLLTTIDADTGNLPLIFAINSAIKSDTAGILAAVQIMDDWDDSDACKSVGNVAHDAADAGKPLKIGAKALDYEPDSSGEQGPAEVAANDRANFAANLRGEIIPAVKPEYWEPDNIDDTYDNVTTTQTSSWHECWQYRHATFGFELDKANTPTDILIEIEVDLGDGNAKKLMNWFLGAWYYDDTTVGTGIEEALEFPIAADRIRIKVTATGTSAVNTFTMANSVLYMRT